MKKILAGVLAVATMLTMSLSASAASNDKAVTKPGELTYDVAVTAPKVVLNLVMPAKMTAALNPYGAEITVVPGAAANDPATNKSTKGIASLAYKVTNKSTDYGVYLDATAITTITTTDKPNADKTPAWSVSGTTVTAGTKGACMSLLALDTVADDAVAAASKAATSSAQGALLLDSTVAADKANGIVAGQTKQAKMAFVKAATTGAGAADGVIYLEFAGDLAKSSSTDEVVWNEDDAINVNLVLKVVAGPKTL